jgi:hypothetical protein
MEIQGPGIQVPIAHLPEITFDKVARFDDDDDCQPPAETANVVCK